MKKICYITTLQSTINSFFAPQINYLANHGFEVDVIGSPNFDLKSKNLNCRVFSVDIPRGISFVGSVKAIISIYRIIKENNYDIVQYSTPNASFYASIAARLNRVSIRNYHLMGFRYFGESGFKRRLLKSIEKITCTNSTSIECVSNSNLEIGIKERVFARDKATVIWNGSTGGVDISRFDFDKRSIYREEIRNKYSISKDKFVFGFAGRITRDKGINELLEAFMRIEDAQLMIMGRMDGENTLDQKLYESSLENPSIIYTGLVSDIEKYYCALDCFVLPSYREGFGNVIIEAAAMGTPAIVTNIPGPVDTVVPERTALLVSPKDYDELAIAMNSMMNSDYKQMGIDAAEYAKSHFDSDVLCEKILERKVQLIGSVES